MLKDARAIIGEAIEAVMPEKAVQNALKAFDLKTPCHVVAIGKAAWRMAAAAQETLGKLIMSGVVITKYGHSRGEINGMSIYEAGHPLPDENSLLGAQAALHLTDGLGPEDTVLFLVSGGGSALFEAPLDGVSLKDMADVTQSLLACGADITQINIIRKHLSKVKAGRFALHCAPAKVLSVVLSDVLGDSLDAIASGPAHPDPSTSADAARIIEKYGLSFPHQVLDALAIETPKTLSNVQTQITGNVTALCGAAARAAKARGYTPLTLSTTLSCEAREAGAFLAAIAREVRQSGSPIPPPCAIILGGETVVHLRGKGKGGRNQELAAAAINGIAGLDDTVIFSVGSDGTDGPTDAAGGMVTGESLSQARQLRLSVDDYLTDNDAYQLLERLDSLIITGPTGTNVNDLTVLLCR